MERRLSAARGAKSLRCNSVKILWSAAIVRQTCSQSAAIVDLSAVAASEAVEAADMAKAYICATRVAMDSTTSEAPPMDGEGGSGAFSEEEPETVEPWVEGRDPLGLDVEAPSCNWEMEVVIVETITAKMHWCGLIAAPPVHPGATKRVGPDVQSDR